MSNPYFSNSAVFGGKADKDVQRTNAQMDPRFAATTSAQYGATDAASLDSMYNSPAATTADTGRKLNKIILATLKQAFCF